MADVGDGEERSGEVLKLARPDLHVGLYGEPHVGKSHLAALFLERVLKKKKGALHVLFFDRKGKHATYEKVWWDKFGPFKTETGTDKRGTPYTEYKWGGKRRARISFYAVAKVEETDGASRLQSYIPALEKEIEKGLWLVVVLDSVSFLALDARKEDQYILNPVSGKGNKQHGMQHYGRSTDVCEEVLCSCIPNLNCDTICIMHESKRQVEAEGTMVRMPHVPGKRLIETNMIAATFPELWRLYSERDEEGKKVRRIQTVSDEQFQAGTIIGVPDASPAQYSAIWSRWDKRRTTVPA